MQNAIASTATNLILTLTPEVVRSWFALGRPKCISKYQDVLDEGVFWFRITNRGRSVTSFRVVACTSDRKDGFDPETEWRDADPFEIRHTRAFKIRASDLVKDGKLVNRVWFSYIYTGRITPLTHKPSIGSMRRMRNLTPAVAKHTELSKQRAARNSPIERWMRGEDVDLGSRSPLRPL